MTTNYSPHRISYVTKDCISKRSNYRLRKGQILTGDCIRSGLLISTKNRTFVQPSTAWILKSGTLTKSAGGGSAVCKVTKASKVSIKEENATHFKVKITKGKKSYTGWIKKSSISFTKTYKNKKSVKTMYLAVNREKADALMGDAVNAINTSYEQCKKGWEYLNEMRKREGMPILVGK